MCERWGSKRREINIEEMNSCTESLCAKHWLHLTSPPETIPNKIYHCWGTWNCWNLQLWRDKTWLVGTINPRATFQPVIIISLPAEEIASHVVSSEHPVYLDLSSSQAMTNQCQRLPEIWYLKVVFWRLAEGMQRCSRLYICSRLCPYWKNDSKVRVTI